MAKWYHISDAWTGDAITVQPRACTRKDDDTDDMTPCICVTPSVGQCVVALGFWEDYSKFRIYEAEGEPKPTEWVFDYELTQEHRFYGPTVFRHVKTLTYDDLVNANLPNMIGWAEKNKKVQAQFKTVAKQIIQRVNERLVD